MQIWQLNHFIFLLSVHFSALPLLTSCKTSCIKKWFKRLFFGRGKKHCKLCYIHKFLKLHFTPSVKSGNVYWLVSSLWRHIVSKCVVATLILNRVFLQPQDLRCKLADQVIVRVVPFFCWNWRFDTFLYYGVAECY